MKSPWSPEKKHSGQLPNSHVALLIFTRYRSTLKHTKTRVAYTYCPGCGKTTKDYGGKKHTYHNYGTLLSDVWRDITCDPERDINAIIVRLGDMFGIEPYSVLEVIDLTKCQVLQPKRSAQSSKMGVSVEASHQQKSALKSYLINQDCLVALRNIRDETIDFCFADPPYNLRKKYEGYNDALEIKEYFTWCDQWLAELARVLKPGCTCAILNIPLWAIRHFSYLSTVLKYQTWIAWEGMSLPVRMIMPAHYAIICFTKGQPRPLPALSKTASRVPREASYLQSLKENFCARSGCIAERRKHGLNDRTPITDLWWDIHRLKHNSYRVDHP
ncbi:MAG: DNA methyltransferase, partial [Nitrososphaera sp.]